MYTIYVLIIKYICPHTTIYVFSCYYTISVYCVHSIFASRVSIFLQIYSCSHWFAFCATSAQDRYKRSRYNKRSRYVSIVRPNGSCIWTLIRLYVPYKISKKMIHLLVSPWFLTILRAWNHHGTSVLVHACRRCRITAPANALYAPPSIVESEARPCHES
jgi:hypothetical protein